MTGDVRADHAVHYSLRGWAHIQVRFDPQTETVNMTDRIRRHRFSIFGIQSRWSTLPAWGKGMHIIDLG